jgi:hypothetical protein
MHRRRMIAVLTIAAVAVVAAALLGRGSTNTSSKPFKGMARIAALHEGGQLGEEQGGAAAEAYSDRAYPAEGVSIDQIQGAIAADNTVENRAVADSTNTWDFVGPNTLNVDRLGTQSFIKPTQWSGRVTALTVDPKCRPTLCRLYTAAAGGGVWRSTNALGAAPLWMNISAGIPTNAIGSITVDPNDATGKTIYVGTGEANGSGDSEAGLGLYKTTDGGDHWSLVPGSFAVSNNRSIAWVAVEPGNASHIMIGTRSGTHGISSNGGGSSTIFPTPPAAGIYNSTDGGTTFALSQAGTFNEVKFDPIAPGTVYAAQSSIGLIRSTTGGIAGSWQTIFSGNRNRYSFSAVAKAGKTRIYLSDASGSGTPSGAQVYRVDDASQPAATLTASTNAAWTRLSNPTDGNPGFAVYNYCNTPLVGSQCFYDMFTMSPADNPDMVVVGGLMHYEELKPYATPGEVRSNGRAVLMSMDAGATWTDVTGDVGGESMHPDQHALAFVPGNPSQFFVGSDGGVIRTSGQWADASSQCDSRGITSPLFLADCKAWLKQIPSELKVLNAGLPTLQMNSISVSPFNPMIDALTGTQDNGTLAYSGSRTWILPLTGDGGDSGFDAVDPDIHFHTYTGAQMDINYHGNDPATWLWIGDKLGLGPEAFRFYAPAIADPVATHTLFVGGTHVWRTTNLGGDRAYLEAHCNTAAGEFGTSDQLYTGNCGTDWFSLGGTPTLTSTTYGTTRTGGTLVSVTRAKDAGTLWTSTSSGRVLITKNANNADPATSTFTRIDGTSQPSRVPVAISVDSTNPDHAVIGYSGFNSSTAATPGHVFDVVYNSATGTATWTDISNDVGDQPVNDVVLDAKTGDVYASTDFTVLKRAVGTTTWVPAAAGLPQVAVSGITLAPTKQGARLLYAATHGRAAWRLRLP